MTFSLIIPLIEEQHKDRYQTVLLIIGIQYIEFLEFTLDNDDNLPVQEKHFFVLSYYEYEPALDHKITQFNYYL